MSSSSLSIKQIKEILDANGSNYSDCIEKEDYVRKLDQVRSGAKPDSAFHADKGASANGGFKGFGGGARNDHNRSDSPPRSNSNHSSNQQRRNSGSGGTSSRKSNQEDSGGSSSNNSDPEVIIKRVSSTTNYYKILGISSSASEEEVKKAYKKLALKLHPDKCKLPGAEEAFKKLAGAFNCLGNADKRSTYDRSGTDPSVGAGGPGGGGGNIDPNDIFRAFFGGGGMPGGMHFQFGGVGNDFQQFFQHQRPQRHHQAQPRRQEEQHVEQQNGLTSLLRFAPILFLLLPQLASVVTSVIRSPWMLLPVAFLAPTKLQKPIFVAAAIIFIMNLI
jgi:DnaJ family protein B protein 12